MSMRRILAAAAATMLVSSGALFVGTSPAAAETTVIPITCLNTANQIVPSSVTLAPGDVLEYTRNGCSRFGIYAYGAQPTQVIPVTVGTVEYQKADGGPWFVTTGGYDRNNGPYPVASGTDPVAVRYTAPSDGTLSDSFYVLASRLGFGAQREGYLISVTITAAPSPAPDAEAPPVPATWSLDLNAGGGVCETSATAGSEGTWQQLPKATECSKAGSTLLGWATSAAFPVGRAKEQVAKGWGAIDEVIDGVRMIFIPAGGYTLITGENSLYAIWG